MATIAATPENIAAIAGLVHTKDIDLGEYKGFFKAKHKRATTLTNDQIIVIIACQDDDENTADSWADLMLAAEEANPDAGTTGQSAQGIAITTAIKRHAIELAERIAENDEYNAHTIAITEAQDVTKLAPMTILMDMLTTFGEDEIKTWPVPGSEDGIKDEKTGQVIRVNNPDRYKVAIAGKKKTFSFYSHFADASPHGVALAKEKELLETKGLDNKGNKVVGVANRASYLKTLTNKLQRIRTVHSQAVALLFQLHAVKELDHVFCDWIRDPKTKNVLHGRQAPIQYYPKGIEADAKAVSIGAFMRFDPHAAATQYGDKNGTVEALESTAAKGTPEETAKAKYPIENMKDFDECLGAFATFADAKANQDQFVKLFGSKLTDDNKHTFETLGDVHAWLEANKSRWYPKWRRVKNITDVEDEQAA